VITNMGAMKRAHRKLVNDTRVAIDDTLKAAKLHALHKAQSTTRFHSQTGKTKKATRARVMRLKGGGKMILRNPTKTALWMERGTRPHVIRAKRGRLAFYWIGGAVKRGLPIGWYRPEAVNHPGTKATWFLKDANQSAYQRAGIRLRVLMKRAAKRF